MLIALTTLLAFQLAGEVLARLLALPVPGPVLGFLVLFIALAAGRLRAPRLETTADNLLRHLPLLFVPAGVGVMQHQARIAAEVLPIATAVLISTALSLVVGVVVFRYSARRLNIPQDGTET